MIRRQPFVEVQESGDGSGGPLLAVRLKPRAEQASRAAPSRGRSRGRSAKPSATEQPGVEQASAPFDVDPVIASPMELPEPAEAPAAASKRSRRKRTRAAEAG